MMENKKVSNISDYKMNNPNLEPNLRIDIPWKPDEIIAYKYVLCEQCEYRRKISSDYFKPNCHSCNRKTYNWTRESFKKHNEYLSKKSLKRVFKMEFESLWMAFGMFATGALGSCVGMISYFVWLNASGALK